MRSSVPVTTPRRPKKRKCYNALTTQTTVEASPAQRKLFRGISSGDHQLIRVAVAEGADVNSPSSDSAGETPLIRAAAQDNPALVNLLLELGGDPNGCERGPTERTALMHSHSSAAAAEALLRGGANPDSRNGAGETALHFAASANSVPVIKLLVAAGADVEARSNQGLAPLDYAIRQGNITPAAEALIATGAELTPERLEKMHAAAADPARDLATLTLNANPSVGLPFAEQFRNRSRPALWMYLAADSLLFAAGGLVIAVYGWLPIWSSCLVAVALGLTAGYASWIRGFPLCPNCRRHIRLCEAVHCHVCGAKLVGKQCDKCGVYQSWALALAPLWRNPGNRKPISYCPNCGVWLDSKLHRFLGGGIY